MHAHVIHGGCGPRAARIPCGCSSPRCEPCEAEGFRHHHYDPGEESAAGLGGAFGVRRPLRFLAWRLHLSEAQVTEFAAILNELKTERAQAAVDDRRALTALADAVAGEGFDAARAGEALVLRVKSAERVQQMVVKSLERMHAQLDAEQRGRLAYLIRTGTLML